MKIQKSFKGDQQSGKLYLVPTPIGNMQDMTFRSIETLKTVDLIASEDTRNTQKLLNYFEIKVAQESFHEHNSHDKIPKLIDFLLSGKSIAQVSDAGMPSISDPGHDLVLEAIKQEIDVIALPGASAGITGLIASGLAPQPHIFYGFLPRKKGEQKRFLLSKLDYPETQIFYESPFRVAETLTNLLEVYGDRQITLVRELTKIYEEYRRAKISEVLNSLSEFPIKGECLIIVAGNDGEKTETQEDEMSPLEAVNALLDTGVKKNVAIKQVAKERGISRQELYNEVHDIKKAP